MRRYALLLMILGMTNSVFAEKGARLSLEKILMGPSLGTDNLYAFQLEFEFITLGPIDIGASLRKEGTGSVDGYGFGVYGSHHWRKDKRIKFVTQAGVRFFSPGVEYSRFQFEQQDGTVLWQKWDRITTTSLYGSAGGVGAWAPSFGFFAEHKFGRVKIRAGIRASLHRYAIEILQRSLGEDFMSLSTNSFTRIIFAPTITIGF